jgi:AcrR family transcriptional regulator
MSKAPARDRLAQAAFALFDERGYEQTTIDDITERAGLGRSTFFRYYRSKDDVIFPDHGLMLRLVRDRLSSASRQTALAAISDAIRLVLQRYIAEGDDARRRYALTSTVPALRDHEIATVARYQRVLREFIAGWMLESGEPASLRAEIMAAAVVAAHNHVLRRWLRGESDDPVTELDAALGQVTGLFGEFGAEPAPGAQAARAQAAQGQAAEGDSTAIVAFRTSQDLRTLVSSLRQIIEIED